jgi:hypothetical protein
VTFTITTDPDEEGIRGSFCTDEPELDRKQEQDILDRVQRGDTDAWCGVIVTATYRGYTGRASIWGCSLDKAYTATVVAEEHGMYDEALQALNDSIATALANLAPIILR